MVESHLDSSRHILSLVVIVVVFFLSFFQFETDESRKVCVTSLGERNSRLCNTLGNRVENL